MTPRVRQYIAEEASRASVPAESIAGRDHRLVVTYARHAVMRRLHADGFTPGQIAMWLECNTSIVRYAIDEDYRKAHSARQRERAAQRNARAVERYATDEAHREKRRAQVRAFDAVRRGA